MSSLLVFVCFSFSESATKHEPNCTLIAISFRNSGYQLLSSWIDPFTKAFEGTNRAKVVKVSITERWSLYFLKGVLTSMMRKNTPVEEHDNTLLFFGTTNVDEFRDVLRMHNIMTGYVFLVDDLGRVRFAGSGEATEEEAQRVIEFAKELTVPTTSTSNTMFKRGKKRGLSPGTRMPRQW